jgi:hypothetical protein
MARHAELLLLAALAIAGCGKKRDREPESHAPPPATRPVAVSPITVPAARAAIPIDGEWEADWNDRAARFVLHEPGGAAEARPYSEVRLLRDGDALLLGLYAADEEIHSNEAFAVTIGGLSFHATAGGKLEPAVPGAKVAIDVDGTVDHPGDYDEEWKLEISIPLAAIGGEPAARVPFHVARCDTPKDGIERCGAWDGELAPRASWPAK